MDKADQPAASSERPAAPEQPSLDQEHSLPFKFIAVMDFEATCEDGVRIKPQEIIEFPMVLLDGATLEVVDEFRTYVRPESRPQLSAFCTELTGIQQAQVDEAPLFKEALHLAQEFLTRHCGSDADGIACVTCGDWDLRSMLPAQCDLIGAHVPAVFQRWINIKRVFEDGTGRLGSAMVTMLKDLGLKLEGRHHSGLDDCRNIARILKCLVQKHGATLGREYLQERRKKGPRGAT